MTEYETQINKLIPEAERCANRKIGRNPRYVNREGKDGRDFRWCMWTQHYHEAMKRLAVDAGLRTV